MITDTIERKEQQTQRMDKYHSHKIKTQFSFIQVREIDIYYFTYVYYSNYNFICQIIECSLTLF